MIVTHEQLAAWMAVAGLQEDGSAQTASYTLEDVSTPEAATTTSVVFATAPDALDAAISSRAGLILSSAKASEPPLEDSRIVRVRDARLAFALVAAQLAARQPQGIHSTAVIHESAQIAVDVEIGAGSIIGAAVTIGPGCRIAARVVIEQGVVLGQRVTVQSGAVLGAYGFGYARKPDGAYVLFPQQGALVLEDDVEIGANSTIDRGALGETRIGAGTKIDNLVHIGHNCSIGRNVILAAQTGISGSTVVQDGAILGGQVGIGEHATVGPSVILGGGAGVLSGKKLFGAGQVFWGRPAQPLKQYLRDLARLRRSA